MRTFRFLPFIDIARWVFLAVVAMAIVMLPTLADAQLPQPLAQPNINLVSNGTVGAMLVLPDGSVVIGGGFISVNGAARSNIAKRRADGTLDPDWHPTIDGYVRTLATDSAGNIYAGGEFQTVNGLARRHLVKLTPAGEVVAGWDPSPDQIVMALMVRDSDDLFVGGFFQSIGGIAKGGLAKVSRASGSADATWSPLTSGSEVWALANSQDGMLVVGGSFNRAGGLDRRNLAKVSCSGSGAADPLWNPSPDQTVTSIAVAPDGAIFIAGEFRQIGDYGPTGLMRWGVAKLAGSGAGAAIAAWDPFNSVQMSSIWTIAIDDSGSVYLGGGLTYFVSSDDVRYGIVKAASSGSGSIDTSWNPSPKGGVYAIAFGAGRVFAGGDFKESASGIHLSFLAIDNTGAPSPGMFDLEDHSGGVLAMARQANGGLIIGGDFVKANGALRRNLLRLNADGSLDPTWNPMANGNVRALAIDAAGSVHAGGMFTHVNGEQHVGMAKLAGDNAGAPDSAWNSAAAPMLAGRVSTLAFDSSGRLYFGGFFGFAGVPEQRNLGRTQSAGSGVVDTTWKPRSMDEVYQVVIDGNASAFVAMQGTVANGTRIRGVAKFPLAGDGTADIDWNPVNYQVRAIALDGQGSIFIGLNKYSTSSGAAIDSAWKPVVAGQARVLAVAANGALYAAEDVYVGGPVIDPYRLSRRSFSGTGTVDDSWNPAVNGVITAMLAEDNAVIIGGWFNQVGTQARYSLAALPLTTPDAVFANGFDTPPSP